MSIKMVQEEKEFGKQAKESNGQKKLNKIDLIKVCLKLYNRF